MARRRGNSEGSICQLKSGSWRAQISVDGHRTGFTAKTRRECQDWLRKTAQLVDEGMTYGYTRITLAEYLESWLISYKAFRRSSTWSHYHQLNHTYVVPHLGKAKVKDLRADHIQAFYNHLLEQNVGIYTIRKIHTFLHSALAHAVKIGMINRNPASAAKQPSAPSKEMMSLDDSQASIFLLALRDHRWEALFYLAITTGMRQGELLGLKWSDIDWIKQNIRIERQLVRPNSQGIQFAPLKTRYSRRVISIGDMAVSILRKHYNRQLADRKKVGDRWVDHGLVFTTGTGEPIHPRNLLREFRELLHNAGLPPIRFHDLRHSHATILLNQGVAVNVVSRRLGHSRASITLDVYTHLIPEKDTEAAVLIEELVTPVELHTIAHDCTR